MVTVVVAMVTVVVEGLGAVETVMGMENGVE